jgi:predicted Zn finger-like uncharacterized protein
MNIRCPNCQTVFRVDPARVPPGGTRARCARCGATFTVKKEDGASPSAPVEAARPEASAPAAVSPPAGAASQRETSGVAPAPRAAGPGAAPAGDVRPSGPAAPAAQPGGAGEQTPRMPFGSRDPDARAQRIARALVSDIVAYHPQRRDESLNRGTLRTDFREEIMKSWEEYVAQVGLDLARSTPHFRNALNDILARGQAVF